MHEHAGTDGNMVNGHGRTLGAWDRWDSSFGKYAGSDTRSQVRKAIRPWTPRSSLQPGTVLILLAGRFRGKRVILLKTLDQGVLLVTGPFKINGVPLRRVNARYVIATSLRVDLTGVDEAKIEEVSRPKYFTAEKAKEKASEEAFFKQGEKPQVRSRVPFGVCGVCGRRAGGLTRNTEETGLQHPGGGPEGHRQGPDCQHQEGRHARKLPRHLVQPPQGRQAPPDEVVGEERAGVMGGGWRGLRSGLANCIWTFDGSRSITASVMRVYSHQDPKITGLCRGSEP